MLLLFVVAWRVTAVFGADLVIYTMHLIWLYTVIICVAMVCVKIWLYGMHKIIILFIFLELQLCQTVYSVYPPCVYLFRALYRDICGAYMHKWTRAFLCMKYMYFTVQNWFENLSLSLHFPRYMCNFVFQCYAIEFKRLKTIIQIDS